MLLIRLQELYILFGALLLRREYIHLRDLYALLCILVLGSALGLPLVRNFDAELVFEFLCFLIFQTNLLFIALR